VVLSRHVTHVHASQLGNLFANEMGESCRVERVSRDVDQWNPQNAGLMGIGFCSVGRNGVRSYLTLEHKLHPVNPAVALAGAVVLGDVFADESKFADFNLDADLLQTFASDGFVQRFAVSSSHGTKR